MINLIDNIIIIGFGLSLLMAISQVTKGNKTERDYLLFSLYLSLSITQLSIWNVSPSLELKFSHLNELDPPFLSLYGPLLYFLYRDLMNKSLVIGKRYFFHFIPFAASTIIMLPYYFNSADYKQKLAVSMFDTYSVSPVTISFTIGFILSIIYFLIIVRGFSILFTKELIKKDLPARIIMILLIIVAGTFSFILAGVIAKNYFCIKLGIAFLSLSIGYIQIMNNHHSNLFQATRETIEKAEARKDLLKNCSIDSIAILLDYEMTVNKPYLNDELTLDNLSLKFELGRHQFSQLLNDHIGLNFNTYVNVFRIREAINMMIHDKERSATSIAYAVGFNNYMTFQKSFKKIAGDTPAVFREKISNY